MFKDLMFIGRTLVGGLTAWMLYWLGNSLYYIFRPYVIDWHRIKHVHNWLMSKSYDVQDWGRAEGPWKQ